MNASGPVWTDLLRTALPSIVDADTERPDLRTLFTPNTHRQALDPDVTVVRGARGAGKTVWFSALQEPVLRALATDSYQLPRLGTVDPIAGYGSALEPERYPGPKAMESLVRAGGDLDDIWSAVLLVALGVPELTAGRTWSDRIEWLRSNPDARDGVIARADREAGRDGRIRLLMFDALDRLHPDRGQVDQLVTGILKLALELRTRTRNIRAKVFIRHDMFNADQLRFPDASKLTANASSLTWTSTNLYGLLFHLMGNAATPEAERFREFASDHRPDASGRWQLPPGLAGEAGVQQGLFHELAGEFMGSDRRRGRTYTWLPNHLVDGIGQVSPRSFLSAVRTAADVSGETYPSHRYALHWDGIRRGVQEASTIRVAEIEEDLPWVADTLRPLGGRQVPIEQGVVESAWNDADLLGRLRSRYSETTSEPDEQVRTGPRNIDRAAGLVDELIQLGIMSRRADGRLDLPDVYRIAFHIGRKGGVPRLPR